MTRVCLLGTEGCDLRYELLSRETARDALATYSIDRPFENSVCVETISLGAAVSLLNDLNWYLVRFVETVLVLEPSVSEGEWLSRALATEIREGETDPADSGRYLMVFGVEHVDGEDGEGNGDDGGDGENGAAPDGRQSPPSGRDPERRLVEPMYVARTGRQLPEYDLRDVEETLVVRVTEAEFGG